MHNIKQVDDMKLLQKYSIPRWKNNVAQAQFLSNMRMDIRFVVVELVVCRW